MTSKQCTCETLSARGPRGDSEIYCPKCGKVFRESVDHLSSNPMNLVERLREKTQTLFVPYGLVIEAADEIERLRAALQACRYGDTTPSVAAIAKEALGLPIETETKP